MTWHIMNGVKLEETKKDLFERSPFIDMPMIRNYSEADLDKFFNKDLEALPSPRLIKTHYPFELLPPDLLDTCKVFCWRFRKVSGIHCNEVRISFGPFLGALCLPQCQGRCCLLLPPPVSHEISRPQMRLHHLCQVLSSRGKC